jgi:hypothetical protein
MKKIGISIIIALVAVFFVMARSHAGTIIVEVTGIKQGTGNIAISFLTALIPFLTMIWGIKGYQ